MRRQSHATHVDTVPTNVVHYYVHMPTSTIPASRARKELFEIIERVQKPATPYVRLTVNGEGKAIIMSEDEWESWQETMDIIRDPAALADIRASEEAFRRGDYKTLDEAFPELVSGSTVEEARTPYGHRSRAKTRGKKRAAVKRAR